MILTDFMNSLNSLTSILASSRAFFCSSFSFLSCFILCCSLETNSPETVDGCGIIHRKITKGSMKPFLTNENLVSFSGSSVTEWLEWRTRHTRVQIPFWPLPGAILYSLEFNSSGMRVKSNLVCLLLVEICNHVKFFYNICFHWPALESPWVRRQIFIFFNRNLI